MPPGSDAHHDVSRDRRRRLSFGAAAEQYDRVRPGYPARMIDDVIAYADARPGDHVLDVGAGTGRAGLLFAQRGYAVTAVEPDREMAAVASRRAATAGQTLALLVSDFETASLPAERFRLIVSGTAWHWVTPGVRNDLAARTLAPGGVLAPFWNRPRWSGHPLRSRFDQAYAAVAREFAARPPGPMNPFGAPTEGRETAGWLEREFAGRDDFTDLETRLYLWRQRYSTEEYLGLLATHSDHALLPRSARERLFAGIRAAIDAAGGSFELEYETMLCLARRRPTSAP